MDDKMVAAALQSHVSSRDRFPCQSSVFETRPTLLSDVSFLRKQMRLSYIFILLFTRRTTTVRLSSLTDLPRLCWVQKQLQSTTSCKTAALFVWHHWRVRLSWVSAVNNVSTPQTVEVSRSGVTGSSPCIVYRSTSSSAELASTKPSIVLLTNDLTVKSFLWQTWAQKERTTLRLVVMWWIKTLQIPAVGNSWLLFFELLLQSALWCGVKTRLVSVNHTLVLVSPFLKVCPLGPAPPTDF